MAAGEERQGRLCAHHRSADINRVSSPFDWLRPTARTTRHAAGHHESICRAISRFMEACTSFSSLTTGPVGWQWRQTPWKHTTDELVYACEQSSDCEGKQLTDSGSNSHIKLPREIFWFVIMEALVLVTHNMSCCFNILWVCNGLASMRSLASTCHYSANSKQPNE